MKMDFKNSNSMANELKISIYFEDYFQSQLDSFSFCSALYLEMLTFDTQNEQDLFRKFLKSNCTFTANTIGIRFNIFILTHMLSAIKKPTKANVFGTERESQHLKQ